MRALLLLGVTGCTAARLLPVPCESTLTCREAFGRGSVCASTGLCEPAALPERCSSDEGLPLPDDVLPVATLFDHSLMTHEARYLSVDLALEQNEGFDGWRFAGLHCDNGPTDDELSRDEATVELARWLAEDVGVPAIVGPSSSSRTVAAYEVTAPLGTLLISPSATASSLASLDGEASTEQDPGLLWRTVGSDELQVNAIVQDMQTVYGHGTARTQPSSQVAVVYQQGAYGEGIHLGFSGAMAVLGGHVQSFVFSDDASRATAIAAAANTQHDELLFVSSDVDDIVALLQAAAALPKLESSPLFLPDAGRNADVLAAAADLPGVLERVRITAPALPTGPVYDAFAVAYANRYGELDVGQMSFTANAFDAAWLVQVGYVWATLQEGAVNGLTIARGLRQVSHGPGVQLGASSWPTVLDSFDFGDPVDVEGASGPLDFGPDGETQGAMAVWVVSADGQDFEAVAVYEP